MSKADNNDFELKNDIDNSESDYDPKKSDFVEIGQGIVTCINVKVAFFLFLLCMIIFSDVFIDNVLLKIPESVESGCTTTKGTIIQIGIVSIGYIFIDFLVQKKWL